MRSQSKIALFSVIFLVVFWLAGRFLLPCILPFLLGTGLALAAEPMVRFLCGRVHLPRGAGAGIGVSTAFFLIACLLLSAAALILQQLRSLSGILPGLEQALVSGIRLLEQWLLDFADLAPAGIRPLLRRNVTAFFSDGTAFLGRAAAYLLGIAGGLLSQIPDGALSLGTTVLSGFMISAKLPQLREALSRRISAQSLQPLRSLLQKIRQALGKWLTAQLKLMGVTWLILTAGFILLAIPSAPLWALAVAAMDALPILGTGTVLIPWSLISFLSGSRVRALGLLSTYITVSLTRTVLEPRLVGKHLGLDPLAALAALYVGFKLWGFGGMILSPLLAVAAVQLFSGEKPHAET